MTETPMAIEFDPHTLKTLGVFDYGGDAMSGAITTAHPHFDFGRSLVINHMIQNWDASAGTKSTAFLLVASSAG